MDQRPTTISFLLINGFSMLSVSAAIEPLRGVNRLTGRTAYRWTLLSLDGHPAGASNGMTVAVDGALSEPPETDVLFVVAGLDADPPSRSRINAGLRRVARGGTVMGALSAGTFILARANLLEGYRSTVHWEFQPAFAEEFPDLETLPDLFVVDRDRWTCAGGVSCMDMMLHMIERDHGGMLTRAVGNQFQIDHIRAPAIRQRPGSLERIEVLPGPMQDAVKLMMANIETPLRMDDIAALSGLNLRRMERMFRANVAMAPGQYYRRIRLERARDLLLHTNLSTLEVACLTGFSSSSHFAMAYQRQYAMRPTDARREMRTPTGQVKGDVS